MIELKNFKAPCLVCTVGLPRSGKTTWAKQWGKEKGAPIVNPDSIRTALHGQRYVQEAEDFVWAIARVMVRSLFLAGHEVVVVDATNTTRQRRDFWQSDQWTTVFYHVDTPCAVCFRRAHETGDKEIVDVIDRMFHNFEEFGEDEIFVRPLGGTGDFPHGKAADDDVGQMRMVIGADKEHDLIRLEFGKHISWLGLTVMEARQMSRILLDKVSELRK